jgi:cell division protein FtsB
VKLRRVVPVFVVLVVIGVLFVGVFPTRTWLAQKNEMAAATEQLRVLSEQNEILAERVEVLHSDDEIERLAREQYNLVKPGEEAYALLPPSTGTTVELPAAGKDGDGGDGGDDRSLPSKIWDFLTFW